MYKAICKAKPNSLLDFKGINQASPIAYCTVVYNLFGGDLGSMFFFIE